MCFHKSPSLGKKKIIKNVVATESMEIWSKMGVWRKVISLGQLYLIENYKLPLLMCLLTMKKKKTISTFTLTFLPKRQLLCMLHMIKYSKILCFRADSILLVKWFCLVRQITGNIFMTAITISPLFNDSISYQPWGHLSPFGKPGFDPMAFTRC